MCFRFHPVRSTAAAVCACAAWLSLAAAGLFFISPSARAQGEPPLPQPEESAVAAPGPEFPVDPFLPGSPPPEDVNFPPAPLFNPGTSPEAANRGQTEAPGISLRPGRQGGPKMLWMDGRQFVVWGGTAQNRSALFTAASAVRREVLAALRQPDQWRHPIILQIREPHTQPPGTPQVWTDIAQVAASSNAPGSGFRLEINITPRQGSVPGPLLKRNLVRAILAEMILRGNESREFTLASAPPPDWLLQGTLELLDYREFGRLSDSFATVFRLGRVLSVEEIFQADADGMDFVSATLYRVSCCGLLMTLLDQPKGTESFSALLSSLVRFSGKDEAAVLHAFPKLGASANSLGKWWSLQIATLAQPSQDELLKPAETEQALAAALILHSAPPAAGARGKKSRLKKLLQRDKPAAPVAPVDPEGNAAPAAITATEIQDFQKLLSHPDRRNIFEQSGLALTKLLMRAHPLYRPIIRDYHEAVTNLAAGKKLREAASVLERLASTRQRLTRDLNAMEDYLDWYQATQATEKTGEFAGFLDAAEELAQPPPQRTDPAGTYLDAVEREFGE